MESRLQWKSYTGSPKRYCSRKNKFSRFISIAVVLALVSDVNDIIQDTSRSIYTSSYIIFLALHGDNCGYQTRSYSYTIISSSAFLVENARNFNYIDASLKLMLSFLNSL